MSPSIAVFCLCFCFALRLQFKRALGSEINFLTVNQKDLTHRTLAEELQAQFEDANPHAAGQVKVDAKFWNSRTGAEETNNELSDVQKRKHQISEWRAREAKEARQRRYEKRQGCAVDVGNGDESQRRVVRFEEIG